MPKRQKYDILIYASNVTGLGATQVAFSLVDALVRNMGSRRVALVIPEKSEWGVAITPRQNLRVFKHSRFLPHRLSRFFEVFFPQVKEIEAKYIINLGDIPLRLNGDQIVLVHQPHLVSPRISADSSNNISFRLMRQIMRFNGKRAKKIIVQSDVIRQQLSETFPPLASKFVVIPQPAPKWLYEGIPITERNIFKNRKLTLFYPAAGYPHKNHALLLRLVKNKLFQKLVEKIITTRSSNSWINYTAKPYIENRGRLSAEEMLKTYYDSDALFFPSKSESYGLPLLEAMVLGLPVICSDRPYARWMCGDSAEYFDPSSSDSAIKSIEATYSNLENTKNIDWSDQLKKFPKSWDEVALKFLSYY
jgi:glycosyltransferase involved in cell wall biosynthesis